MLIENDLSGDVTSDGKNQYLYDGEGRICAVMSMPMPSVTTMTGYIYDAGGTRVSKGTLTQFSCDMNSANSDFNGFQPTNDYVLGLGGEQAAEMGVGGTTDGSTTSGLVWQHTNIWAAGKLLGTYDGGAGTISIDTTYNLHFYFDDPLGTRRVQTDYAGVVEQTCQSLPYGDGETCAATPTENLFTGKERDAESGNDYFEARYYSSVMGRFMSPDWSAKAEPVPYAKLDNPQSLNLYAYVGNNPLSRVDADGHCDSSSSATANTKCQDVKNLHVNDAMKQKIKNMEGLSADKKKGIKQGDPALTVYKDKAGNPTVGWGHMDPSMKVGDTITKDQAQAYFDKDVSTMESKVADVLNSNGGHQFSQGEFNGLVDLTYNGGPGMLTAGTSPNLMKDMNAGDYTGMSGQLRYTKDSAGNVEPGLERRSDDRKAIFLGSDPD